MNGSPLDQAASVLADAWAPALAKAYELGKVDGYATGARDVERQFAESWAVLAAEVRARASRPSAAELRRAWQPTYQPCSTRCDACSACFASRAYWSRGGRPYLGADAERAQADATKLARPGGAHSRHGTPGRALHVEERVAS